MHQRSNAIILEFERPIWNLKGPAPDQFLMTPPSESVELCSVQQSVTYGWSMIPVDSQIDGVRCSTSLFSKGGGFVAPI